MLNFFKPGKDDTVEVSISSRTVLKILGFVILSYLFVILLRKSSHALTMIFFAFFFSLALNAPVNWIAHRLPGRIKGSRTAATAVSFVMVIAIIAAFLISFVPALVKQTSTFLDAAPGLVEDLRDENTSLGGFVRRYNLENQVDKVSGQLSGWIGGLGGTAFGTISRVGSNIFSTLTVLVLTFMMIIEGPRWLEFARKLMPKEKEPHAERLANDMYRVIKGYINGQVLLAAVAAFMIAIPILILGIPYPVALVVIVFICGLIPMIGHTLGAAIVTTVALFESPLAAAIILAYYILYQQIENYAVQPKIQSNSTNMSPLLVLISLVVGVSINGIIGGLVAIPIAGCLRILVLDYLYANNYLTKAEVTKETAIKADTK